MADNKIVHRVTIEGLVEAAKNFVSLGDDGERAFKQIKQAADNTNFDRPTDHVRKFNQYVEEGNEVARRFREAIHTIHPVLDQIGLGLSNLGAFAGAARVGLTGLGVASSAPSWSGCKNYPTSRLKRKIGILGLVILRLATFAAVG